MKLFQIIILVIFSTKLMAHEPGKFKLDGIHTIIYSESDTHQAYIERENRYFIAKKKEYSLGEYNKQSGLNKFQNRGLFNGKDFVTFDVAKVIIEQEAIKDSKDKRHEYDKLEIIQNIFKFTPRTKYGRREAKILCEIILVNDWRGVKCDNGELGLLKVINENDTTKIWLEIEDFDRQTYLVE